MPIYNFDIEKHRVRKRHDRRQDGLGCDTGMTAPGPAEVWSACVNSQIAQADYFRQEGCRDHLVSLKDPSGLEDFMQATVRAAESTVAHNGFTECQL